MLTMLHADCAVTTLKANEVTTVVVTLNPSAASGQLSASATARESDPTTANNSVSISVQPPPPPPPSSKGGGGGALSGSLLLVLLLGMARRAIRSS
jgi:hypothetical protein